MSSEELPAEVREYLRQRGERLGKEHGAKGAAKTNAKLTPAKRKRAGQKAAGKLSAAARKARAQTAAAARWGNKEKV